MNRILIIAFALSVLQSCKLLFKATGNLKNPQPETVQSIKDYMGQDMHYNGLYRAESVMSLKYFTDSVGRSIPFVYVFNNKMQSIYKSKTCAWNNAAQLDSLRLSDDWEVNTSLDYSQFSKYLKLVDGMQLMDGYDYAVFFVWAKFVPKLSKKMLVQMNKQFKSGKSKLYIGSVNLDLYNP